MKTWAQLKTEIRQQIWPSGEAENLVVAHDQLFQEGAADIAQWVECEQENNVNVIHFCKTFFKCGLTVIEAPDGIITRVYTVANEEFCDPVTYVQRAWPAPECWSKNILSYKFPLTTGFPKLPLGFMQAEKTTDSTVGRARVGIWAMKNGNIYIAPWIQSNEFVVIEWNGIKKVWGENDLVTDTQRYKTALKLFLQYAHERDYGSMERAKVFLVRIPGQPDSGLYADALGDLIWWCREQRRVRETEHCTDERARTPAELADDAVPAEPGPKVIAQIANFADADDNVEAVANLVRGFTPTYIITAGNNSKGDYPASVGRLFGDYVTAKKFLPTPGEKDWGMDDSNPYFEYFPWLNGRRYYDFAIGDVRFFVLNSDDREVDGNTLGSPQGIWLRDRLKEASETYKIVLLHHPPFSSSSVHGSTPSLQWPFEAWGATTVIAGHDHDYERILVGGIRYFVNGVGGRSIRGFTTPVSGSEVRISAFGAMRIQLFTGGLKLEFWTVAAGAAVDSLTIGTPTGDVIKTIACIGDWGGDTTDEANVAALVKTWTPDAIVTVGDNVYASIGGDPDDAGLTATLDEQFGKYYQEFMFPYVGSFGPGATENKFFPALGNHDLDFIAASTITPATLTEYLDYFSLPGHERYYDVCLGDIHLFFLDSDANEPDGIAGDSTQAQWLRAKLALSTAPWKVVVLHESPYSSTAPNTALIWTYGFWGAHMVISGKARNYERFNIQGVPFINQGLGGDGFRQPKWNPVPSMFFCGATLGPELAPTGTWGSGTPFFSVPVTAGKRYLVRIGEGEVSYVLDPVHDITALTEDGEVVALVNLIKINGSPSQPRTMSVKEIIDDCQDGAGRITATETSLLYEFVGVDGSVIDSVELTK